MATMQHKIFCPQKILCCIVEDTGHCWKHLSYLSVTIRRIVTRTLLLLLLLLGLLNSVSNSYIVTLFLNVNYTQNFNTGSKYPLRKILVLLYVTTQKRCREFSIIFMEFKSTWLQLNWPWLDLTQSNLTTVTLIQPTINNQSYVIWSH